MASLLGVSICLFILCSAVTALQELHCSRFHYEEKLLEKVIRSEIRIETIDAAVEKVRKDMVAEIQTLRGIFNSNLFTDNVKQIVFYLMSKYSNNL